MSKGVAKFFEDPFNGLNIFNNDKPNIFNKPLELFADDYNNYVTADTPKPLRPYTQPLATVALGAINPFLGAAFNTALTEGNSEAAGNNLDWGTLGKNAAINFGTAGVADLAKNALTADNIANATNQTKNALSAFDGGSSSALQSTVDAAKVGTSGALNAFTPGVNVSLSSIPLAAGLQSSGGLKDAVYQQVLKSAGTVANQALDATLAPPQAQPISSVFENFTAAPAQNTTPELQYGDILNAFGGTDVNTPNPDGPRIGADAFNQSVNRLAANDFLQQNQARDTSLPAGQYQPGQNTPYANQLTNISKGTTQAYSDLLDETNNANNYYGIIDSNPGLTNDQLNTYLQDPSSGVLGAFSVSPDAATYLQGIKPLSPVNTPLLL